MSTKTLRKRIALVAVASLGFGVLTSVAPASAAMSAAVNRAAISALGTAATGATSTAKVARVGSAYTLPVTLSTTATEWTAASDLTLNAVFSAVPAGETAYNTVSTTASSSLSPTVALNAAVDTAAEAGDVLGDGTDLTSVAATAATGSVPAFVEFYFAASESAQASLAATNVMDVTFTPSVAGTYKIFVWADDATGGNTNAYDGGEISKVITIVVGGAPASVTLSTPSSSVATNQDFATNGALLIATIKDAAGNPTTLSPTEAIAVTTTAGTLSDASITVADVNSLGLASVNLYHTAAATATVTFTAAGSLAGVIAAKTTTVTFTAVTSVGFEAGASVRDTSGFVAQTGDDLTDIDTTDEVLLSTGKSSLTIRLLDAITAAEVGSVKITDVSGAITGIANAAWVIPVSVDATNDYGTVTISGLSALEAGDAVDVDWVEAGAVNLTITATDRAITSLTLTPASATAVTAGTVSLKATAYDQFSDEIAGAVVAFSVSGRNATTVSTQVLTNADGEAVYALTDTSTSTTSLTSTVAASGTYNAVTVNATSATVTFGAYTVATNTMATPITASATATTTISTAVAGAQGSYATVTATLTSAAGTLVGVPVTFAVSGLAGAGVVTNYSTVYTDANGVATSRIYSYATGTATVTATAGGVASTGTVKFINAATDARTIAAAVSGNLVTATVKDRYGNPVKDVNVVFSRVGAGYFGTGGSAVTVATNAAGVAEAVVVNASDNTTVTATLDVLTYAQVDDAAGYVGTTAVTATGAGADLAPAGVATATAVVVGSVSDAQVAADAAAEATDAANAATDAANAAAEAADAATAAAQDAADAVAALSTQVSEMVNALKKQITALTNLVIKIQKKVKA